MKVRELKDVLADAEDEAEVIVKKFRTGAVTGRRPDDVFEAFEARKQPSGKVSISYDESKRTDN
ncbi:MAG TPA: hypothetical protein VNN25_15550 [Thermoanaerobaculia bacterium]|nr:hypothetical protein [Thermoanaerobaculia bacterium]